MQDINLEIKTDIEDAPEFIKSINKIIVGFIGKFQVDEICLIKIKNWFDHKWLNFSGKSVVQFHGGNFITSALQDEWREKTTVLPFNPNRVLSEIFYRINPTDNRTFEQSLHKTKSSNDNIHNRIANYTKNGMFIWYSSDTERNQKGSLMIYIVKENFIETCYASFENINGWKVKQTKNVSTNELTAFLSDQ